jgi:signal transduction histidine kinase/ligand-binding sensor domain-containing protein/DNA-binding response OmpR family regulator
MNCFRILLTIVACTMFLWPAAQTGQYSFSHLDISNGLSHNQVNAILRDNKGFMWFGTMSGLNRFDGYNFKVFRHKIGDSTSLSDDLVNGIMDGPDGKLWINTSGGQNIFDPVTGIFFTNTATYLQQLSMLPGNVLDIVRDTLGDYWFLQPEQGVTRYRVAARKAQRVIQSQPNQQAQEITDIAIDSRNKLWVVRRNGVLEQVNATTHRVMASYTALFNSNQGALLNYRLFVDAAGGVWIFALSEQRGVFYFDPVSGNPAGAGPVLHHLHTGAAKGTLNNNLITGIQQDNSGGIWISTDHGGINIVNTKTWQVRYLVNNADDSKSLSQNSINAIYRDQAGIVWVGTYKKGLNYYHEGIIKFPVYRHQPSDQWSLPFDDVNRFVEDDKGNLWIGTNGGGLIYFDRQHGTWQTFKHNAANTNSISNDVIVSLCIDHEKKLWIGSYFGGLDCYDGQRFTHYKHDPDVPGSISDNRIWEIYEDAQRQLWIGTLSGGLNRFDRDKKIFHHYKTGDPNSILSNYITAITEDREGNLWVGTGFGISVLNRKTDRFVYYNYNISDSASLSNNNIITFFEDSRGMMWIGTREGLNLYDKVSGGFRHFRMEDGLPGNVILTILEDDEHNLWISTPNGISKAVVSATGPGHKNMYLQFTNYDERDGLQGREFNENAALKTRRGELLFGGANGFNIINPRAITHNTFIPPVVLTDFQVFDKSIEVGEVINKRVLLPQNISAAEQLVLKYYENVFSLEFAALSFSNPEKNRYAYKLEGFHKDWFATDGRQRKATFTNLDPGDYVFRVKASNDDGLWNEQGVALRIRILPPFWKTIPAFILYALLLAAILVFARRLIIQRARMRFRMEQQKKEADQLHELDMMKLKFFTNVSHEFRTPLSLIMAPAEKMIKQATDEGQKKQFQLIYRNAKRLLGLVNQLMDFRKLEMQELRLHPATGNIVHFVKELVYSFTDIAEKKNITYTFHASIEELDISFDPDKLERIMFNLLSNAFKFTSEKGTVAVAMGRQEVEEQQYVQIKVSDSGIGIPKAEQDKIFERFFQYETPGSILNQGSGIGLAISKEFVRLHNGMLTVDSEPDKGTTFTILLPVTTPAENLAPLAGTEMVINTAHEEKEQAEAHEKGTRRKPAVLIIDDNEDIRFYLKDNLRRSYIVYEAMHGKEGWEKARRHQPDLVVSDIMMPEMNGIELCRKIKSDPHTSHIPVILLTARTAEEQKLEGFDSGANDFITKPFSIEILQARIRNLLLQQETMRRLFQKQIEVNPSDISITSVDEQFIRHALEEVEKNISNPDFSVEDLSRSMHMSRVALYKKLLSLTGKPPLDFIRSIRMKRAAQLLEKSQLNISEIAYEVGFNNPKYFARFFKKEFNVLPSEYRGRKPEA